MSLLVTRGLGAPDSGGALASPSLVNFVLGTPAPNYQTIVKGFLNPALKGKGWDALVAAIAAGDQINFNNAQLAYNQLYLSTANLDYLDQRASDVNISRPKDVGMGDELFRKLAIQNTASKLTEEAINEVIEIFYGEDALRANILAVMGPYALTDGDDLSININGTIVYVVFNSPDFTNIAQASAIEVASVINRALRDVNVKGFAVVSSNAVKVYSSSIGLSSHINVTGGKAQRVLQFPTPITTYSGLSPIPTWNIALNTTTGNWRFTTSTNPTSFSIYNINPGDIVVVSGTEFNVGNCGSFVILNTYSDPSGLQWFEISNIFGYTQTVVQLSQNSVFFFRPTKHTTYTNTSRFSVAYSDGKSLNITVPATSTAVNRGIGKASYLQNQNTVAIQSLSKNPGGSPSALPITTNKGLITVQSTGHGLSVGDQILIEGTANNSIKPIVTAGNNSVSPYTTDCSPIIDTLSKSANLAVTQPVFARALALPDGRIQFTGGATYPIQNPPTIYDGGYLVRATAYNPTNNQYTYTITPETAVGAGRFAHAIGLLFSSWGVGDALLTGGVIYTGGAFVAQKTAYIYRADPAGISAGTWVRVADMNAARAGHAQINLTNGKVLVCGGYDGTSVLNSVEIYDPSANTWTTMAPMQTARCNHKAIRISTTRNIIMGGRTSVSSWANFYNYLDTGNPVGLNGVITNTCESYNRTANTWIYVGNMALARMDFGTYTTSDRNIYVFGGIGYNPSQSTTAAITNTTEFYDVLNAYWIPSASMNVPRANPFISFAGYVFGGDPSVEKFDINGTKKITTTHLSTGLTSNHFTVGADFATNYTNTVAYSAVGSVIGYGSGSNNVFVHSIVGTSWASGNVNGRPLTVNSVVDANNFTINPGTTDNGSVPSITNALIYKVKAQSSTLFKGPYVYDTQSKVSYTHLGSTISNTIFKGNSVSSLTVANGANIPNSTGYLIFNYGYKNQVGPVKYLGKISTNVLKIDPSFVFTDTVLNGSAVRVVNLGSVIPTNPQNYGGFYLTASTAGLYECLAVLKDTVGHSLPINVLINYPGDNQLGGARYPTKNNYKVSDIVSIFSNNYKQEPL